MTCTTTKATPLPTSVSTPAIELPTNCSNCPYFDNYQEKSRRGWCNQRDRLAYSHHDFTHNCELNLLHDEEALHSEFNQGDLVKLISSTKHHSQWTTSIVISKRYNPNPDKADWDYLLATTEDLKISDQWIAENRLCHQEQSYNINPDGEF